VGIQTGGEVNLSLWAGGLGTGRRSAPDAFCRPPGLCKSAFAPKYMAGYMGCRKLLELLAFVVVLLVLMPLLLLWVGKFAKYCAPGLPTPKPAIDAKAKVIAPPSGSGA